MKKKTIIYTLKDVIQQELKSFSEQYEFPINMYDSFFDVLKQYLQKLIADKVCTDNKIIIELYEAKLFHLDNNLVLINDVIKMISGNKPENMVFRHRLAKQWNGFLVNTPDENKFITDLCNAHMPSFDNTMSIAVDKSKITNKASINKQVNKIVTLLKYVPWIKNYTSTTIKSKLTRGFKASAVIDQNTGKQLYVNKNDSAVINLFIDKLKVMNWKLYYGLAGTGKSWNAINDIKKSYNKNTNILCMSLANKMQISLKERMINSGISEKQIECSPYAGAHKVDFERYNNDNSFIIIDELSQAGMDEYKMLCVILNSAPKAKYIFMGDTNQIKSFLSRGSVLNTIIEVFKGTNHITELVNIKRSSNIGLINALKTFVSTGKLDKLFDAPANYKLTDYDVILTGANANVGQLNNQYVSEKFNIPSGINISVNSVDYTDAVQGFDIDTRRMLVTAMRKGKSVNLFGGKTGPGSIAMSPKSKDKVKIVNGEKWIAKYDRKTDMIKLTACIDNSKVIYMPPVQFINTPYFEPGYAINVNKAQGLEWDKVLVKLNMDKHKGPCDKNVYKNLESMYVALSRGKVLTHLDCNGKIENECKRYIKANNYLEAQLK